MLKNKIDKIIKIKNKLEKRYRNRIKLLFKKAQQKTVNLENLLFKKTIQRMKIEKIIKKEENKLEKRQKQNKIFILKK